MKSGYAVAFIITIAVLCYCAERTGKSKKKIAVSVRNLLLLAALTVLGNLFVVLSENELVSLISYSIFFIGIDWLLYSLLIFSVEYTSYQAKGKAGLIAIRAILLLDSISMAVNTIFQHAYSCKQVLTESGENYYRINIYFPYEIHLGISYLMLVGTIACLIYKCYVTPAFYRRKYVVVMTILGMVILGDAVYVFMDSTIDASILLFALGGSLVYYYSVEYIPKEIINKTLALVVEGLSDGVILFDVDGKCAYVNDYAKEFLDVEASEDVKLEMIISSWSRGNVISEVEDFSCDHTEIYNGKTLHLKVKFRRMQDGKQRYLGSIFVIQDHTEEVNKLKEEHYLVTHDSLTGLYNKDYFYDQAKKQIVMHPEIEYLIVCSDVKDFKLINDVFGVATGDVLLCQIAMEIKKGTRPGQIYGRLQNDRFGLLMEKQHYKEYVFSKGPANAIHVESDISYPVPIYVGVYEVVDKSLTIAGMCDRAFMAIQSIKGNYEKRVAYYDEDLRNSVLREKELSGELEEALSNGQFQIYLQPQITAEGTVPGAEALVRWAHPQRGLIMPGEFIEIFEKNGMIAKLDQYVWKLACECLRKWKKAGKTEQYISVNISPKDFYFIDVYQTITDLVKHYDIEPRNLKLEITETAIMMSVEQQSEIIRKLRDAGFVVEMDDFGSGYSSLNMLKDIHVDELKVDMKFLGKTQDEERGRKILRMVVELSKQLDMPVVIEGVETIEQVKFLKEIGCDVFQGFFFARPVAVAKFEETYL